MSVSVQFEYDEATGRWEIFVHGCSSAQEARQALNAVVITCEDVVPCMEHKVRVVLTKPGVYQMDPAVTIQGHIRSKLYKGGV